MQTKDLKTLLSDFHSGDMGAFAAIYSEFERLIWFYAHKLGQDDADQELTVFLLELLWKINPAKAGLECPEDIKRYIAVSIRNKYIALSRAEQKQNAQVELSENITGINMLYDVLGNLVLCEALEKLTEKQRETFLLKYVYEYTNCEIAKKLNISRQAVNQLKNRAIEVLRNYYFEGEQ